VSTVLRSRPWLITVVIAFATTTAACSTHPVAVTRPCPAVTRRGTVIAAPYRGGVGLAKVGLTPAALKAREKCR
jgi:hypothetical protein